MLSKKSYYDLRKILIFSWENCSHLTVGGERIRRRYMFVSRPCFVSEGFTKQHTAPGLYCPEPPEPAAVNPTPPHIL